ncbi:conjugal transfer protein MobC [Pedobacter xixiisoli]|uniref:Type IV secretory system Conjugative DNA transfer n=1 Tax=Pedobacter xixiisoli TaxID=1476464 RepID=A0A285ZWJ5_9SPHI|nr:conjugal transfer protein MobC [Pedobacter xixiisoli]SOD14022.1 Type IV secretory system Conjugative DNA transfer [Pedobacter xixiisoli]
MQTGEDTQGLRKIIDLTRLISIFILAIHFYMLCYRAFREMGWTAEITDRIVTNIAGLGLFNGLFSAKAAALLCLLISLMGAKGRKDEKADRKSILLGIAAGLLIYWLAFLSLYMRVADLQVACLYIGLTIIGYLLILNGGVRLTRLIKGDLNDDIFNSENETFPQEERLLENEFSINLPAKYHLRKEERDSWINIINPFRGLLVAGTPGAGKSYFVIRHIIDQHIRKGFTMFLYDFKFDDLSKIAYNKLLQYCGNYQVKPKFYVINFDDLDRTHRCNPLDPLSMGDLTDATEASRTIMMGLNRDWIKKQGDFFVESPINFLTAIIWYLRCYDDGKYCTLPHVIELMQVDYDRLFTVLSEQPEIQVLINPFISAWRNNASAQLEGQIASAKIGLARLSSASLYYVLSGNDFTLDVNNPKEPKIICVGNNPQKLQTYGAVLSLYISRMIKLVNRKGQQKSSLVFDEFPTIYFNNMDSLIATARSNKVATTLAVQDFSQLKKDYGAEQAEVITGIVGNVISGQVTGDTAKKLSETFGKISQQKESRNISSSDVSISQSSQMDYAVPASKIAALSSGEFVGFVADNPEQKIGLKMFHSEIQNDHVALAREEKAYVDIPFISKVSKEEIAENYDRIKKQVIVLVSREIELISNRNKPVQDAESVKQERPNKKARTMNKKDKNKARVNAKNKPMSM